MVAFSREARGSITLTWRRKTAVRKGIETHIGHLIDLDLGDIAFCDIHIDIEVADIHQLHQTCLISAAVGARGHHHARCCGQVDNHRIKGRAQGVFFQIPLGAL